MKIKYDRESDALYIYLNSKPYAFGQDLDDERRIDYADDSTPMGVELLYVGKGVNLEGLPEAVKIGKAIERKGIKTYKMKMKKPDFIISEQWRTILIEINYTSSARIDDEKSDIRIPEEVTV